MELLPESVLPIRSNQQTEEFSFLAVPLPMIRAAMQGRTCQRHILNVFAHVFDTVRFPGFASEQKQPMTVTIFPHPGMSFTFIVLLVPYMIFDLSQSIAWEYEVPYNICTLLIGITWGAFQVRNQDFARGQWGLNPKNPLMIFEKKNPFE